MFIFIIPAICWCRKKQTISNSKSKFQVSVLNIFIRIKYNLWRLTELLIPNFLFCLYIIYTCRDRNDTSKNNGKQRLKRQTRQR